MRDALDDRDQCAFVFEEDVVRCSERMLTMLRQSPWLQDRGG